jgi:class 3 adenylate cyclase
LVPDAEAGRSMRGNDRTGIPAIYSYVPELVVRRLVPVQSARPHAEGLPAALLMVDITGFTAATTAAVRRGAIGTEHLSRALNAYLGTIIDLIIAHGGDVAKIVGDALIPIWPADDEDLATVSRRAATCGLAIARELDEFEIEEGQPHSVKVGLCAGEIVISRVGGLNDKWLFVISGDGTSQLQDAARQMLMGSVVASPDAWSLITAYFVGEPLDAGHVRIQATRGELTLRPLAKTMLDASHEPAVRAYVPDVTLARLDAGQAEWLAELRRTCVIFANVRGPVDLARDAAQLQLLASAAQRAMRRYDGWLKEVTVDEKGTTLVAVFGIPPFSHEDDAKRAIHAALAIRAEIQVAGLSARIGVTTGYTFCGPVGNSWRRDFVALGQHVNLAARLMQAAAQDEVLCDRATHDDATGLEYFERLPQYVLKGMESPTDVYRIQPGGLTDLGRSDLVDRGSELAVISVALRSLADGAGGVVVLEGEPGIGKSRLITEISRQAQGAGIRTLVGRAAEIESATPYHAWRAIFERLIGLDTIGGDPSVRRATVLDRLGSDEARGALAPLLNPVLSLDIPDNETTIQLAGAVRADNTCDLLVHLLGQEASHRPMLLVVEDAHWLDSASWNLIGRVQSEIPVLLQVVTLRPLGEVAAVAVSGPLTSATTLRIAPLGPEDVLTLACQRTGASRLSPEVANVIQGRAEGNPLFIEQLTYAMRDAGRIIVDNGLCRAVGGAGLEADITPDTVQRVITTRLDQLPPAEAMTLKVASVIGHKFALRTLADIHPVPTQERILLDHLNTLTRLDLLEPIATAPELSYQFRHVITQEVTYKLMPSEQSRELHRRLAEWHERVYATDLAPFHAFLAHHWRYAGESDRAIDYLEQAGSQALHNFANDEAVGFFTQALVLADQTEAEIAFRRRAGWQLKIGEANVNMSRYREGWYHLDVGLEMLGRPPPPTQVRRAFGLAGLLIRQILRRIGLISGMRKLSKAEVDDLIVVCRAYGSLAEVSYYGRERLLPLYCVIRVLNEAEATGSPTEIARGSAGSGALLGVVPLHRLAEWYLQRAMLCLEKVDDLTTHEIVEIVVGFYYIGAAKWSLARDRFRSVRRTARRLGDRRRFDDAIANLMELEYLHGNFGAAGALADELRLTATARNDQRFLAESLIGRAYSSWLLGDVATALGRMEELSEILTRAELTYDLKLKYFGLNSLIQASRDEALRARAACEEAMRMTSGLRPSYFGGFLGYVGPAEVYSRLWEGRYAIGDDRTRAMEAHARLRGFARVFPIGRPRYRLLKGRQAWLLGRRRRAKRAYESAIASAEALHMPYEAALAHLEIARRLGAEDPAKEEHLRQGREILDRIGVTESNAGS